MKNNFAKTNRGFTLIEVIIYVLLFALLVGGTASAAYNIIRFNNINHVRNIMCEEGNFITAKISWVLSGIKSVDFPVSGTPGSFLSVAKSNEDSGVIKVEMIDNNIIITRNETSQILNSNNVSVRGLVFTYQKNSSYQSVNFEFVLDAVLDSGVTISDSFGTTKYLRN